ncbi:MAG: HTH domain-containing protein [Candidatus Pacearchaeota archaeon]
MDNIIKNAFQKVKQDFQFLYNELIAIKTEFFELKKEVQNLKKTIDNLNFKEDLKKLYELAYSSELKSSMQTQPNQFTKPQYLPLSLPTQKQETTTISTQIPTQTNIPTDELPYYALKSYFKTVSIGNEGVPTDRQTNRQTDNQHIFKANSHTKLENQDINFRVNHLEKAKEILDSLDNLKKEVRIKFKKLTDQEMKIFALLYQLNEEGELVDYSTLAKKTNLSESSIRDYIRKISLKGIPIIKEKLKNKRVLLHISHELKKIATLDTIFKLREI